jgi:hypothetical protein
MGVRDIERRQRECGHLRRRRRQRHARGESGRASADSLRNSLRITGSTGRVIRPRPSSHWIDAVVWGVHRSSHWIVRRGSERSSIQRLDRGARFTRPVRPATRRTRAVHPSRPSSDGTDASSSSVPSVQRRDGREHAPLDRQPSKCDRLKLTGMFSAAAAESGRPTPLPPLAASHTALR